ncbi:hypothetical protein [Effusibacillus dendaii]|uniref:DUF2294 domain-containing protein n=1 Tax=Effusibacillus dendaii TaxID=2743772 RepID=A0A7I8DGK7_9BACL|nr:hypothetical protein [Effusibacillus dendaii]BCJ88119.1 hypothetical protein skT53_31040 [Effusibacillus dendaii]
MEISREFYYDWNLVNKTGVFVGLSPAPLLAEKDIREDFIGKERLEEELIHISQNAQKAPDRIYSCQMDDRTVLIIREGLEKRYLHNNGHFEEYLKRQVVDSFVDWDFDQDKSVIVVILNRNPADAHE